jgi:hypothetical protein
MARVKMSKIRGQKDEQDSKSPCWFMDSYANFQITALQAACAAR